MATVGNPTDASKGGFFGGATELATFLVQKGRDLNQATMEAALEIKEIDGIKYVWNRNNYRWEQIKPPIPDDVPVPATFKFFTLDGILEYIKQNTEGLIPSGDERLILQVVDETSVRLWSLPSKNHKERHVIAACDAHVPNVPFGRWLDVESFNTMLLSNFLETSERDEVFKVVKSMTREQNCNTSDDGVSQVITVKQGVSLVSNTQFKNPVPLQPMRTFTEVDQPESNFTLRVNGEACVALFEADGGAWKNEAVENIKQYLVAGTYASNVVVIA